MKMTRETAVSEILTHINTCYQDSTKPSAFALVALYAQVGEVLSQMEDSSFNKEMAKIISKECPSVKGFSLRNLNRMADFYSSFSENADLLSNALTIGWTQNIVILESCHSVEEKAFYVAMVQKQELSKSDLISEIESNAFETAKKVKMLEKVAELHETVFPTVAPVCPFVKGTSKDTSKSCLENVAPPVGKLRHFLQGSSPPKWMKRIPWRKSTLLWYDSAAIRRIC